MAKHQANHQLSFEKINWKHHYSHGGTLRNLSAGRKYRPLSGKDPLHLVLKANREALGSGFRHHRKFQLIHEIVKRYAKKFFVKIEQISVQGDHIHLLIRATRRSNYQSFFRVLAGQIAQRFQNEGLVKAVAAKAPTREISNSSNAKKAVSGSGLRFTTTPIPRETKLRTTKTPNSMGNEPGSPMTDTPKPALGTGMSNSYSRMADSGPEVDPRFSTTDTFVPEGVADPRFIMTDTPARRLKLWKYRPFTRVIRGWKAYKTARAYVQLNEKEALGEIPYRKERLCGLSETDWGILWA